MKEDFYSWRITNIDPIGRALDHRELMLLIWRRSLKEKCKYICKCLPPLLEKQLIWAFRICGGRLEEIILKMKQPEKWLHIRSFGMFAKDQPPTQRSYVLLDF